MDADGPDASPSRAASLCGCGRSEDDQGPASGLTWLTEDIGEPGRLDCSPQVVGLLIREPVPFKCNVGLQVNGPYVLSEVPRSL